MVGIRLKGRQQPGGQTAVEGHAGVGVLLAVHLADDELHGVPVAVAANLALSSVLDQFMPVLRRAERLRFGSLSGRRSVSLHERLITALERGDAAAATEASTATWHTLSRLIDLDVAD